jgi:hypothetical protein
VRSIPFLLLVACAAHRPAPADPSYAPIALEPAPPRATLYADCLADAIANHRVSRAQDATTSLLVFTCEGAPAQAFYDGLAAWSAREHSEFMHDGRTFRSTARVRHDLFGVDYCAIASDHGAAASTSSPAPATAPAPAAECVISLNAGEFVR